jgi:hypothetical protein
MKVSNEVLKYCRRSQKYLSMPLDEIVIEHIRFEAAYKTTTLSPIAGNIATIKRGWMLKADEIYKLRQNKLEI